MKEKYINSNIIVVLLCIVVFTMPLKSSINSISIILFLIYSLFFIYRNRNQIIFSISRDVFVLILPFLFILLQGLYSEWYSFSKNAIRSLPLIIFPLLIYYLRSWICKERLRIVLRVLVFSSLGYGLFLLIVAFYRQIEYNPHFSDVNWYFFTYYDFTEVLSLHPTYLGMYCCLAIAVILHYLFIEGKHVLLNIFSLSFLGVIILLSGSRISLVCLILIVLNFLLFYFKRFSFKNAIILFAILIIVPLVVMNLVPIVKERMIDMTLGLKENYQYAQYGDGGSNNNYTGGLAPRFQIWNCTMEISNNDFLFGNGFGYTQKLLNECYESKGMFDFSNEDYQTHNQYFNNYARGGVIGLLILLLIYFYSMFSAVKRKNLIYTSLLIIVMVTSLTENILNRQLGIVFFSLFNSLFFYSTNKDNKWK